MFFIFTQKVIHHFPAHIFLHLTMPGYPHKAFYFKYRLCHKIFSGEDQAWIIEINCTDYSYFLCDRVWTQSKKLKEDILVAFDHRSLKFYTYIASKP